MGSICVPPAASIAAPFRSRLSQGFGFTMLTEYPHKAVVGEVAHELARAFLGHRLNAPSTIREEADETARLRGFPEEIDALKSQ